MTDADRIPCLNPRCRRTAPAEKYASGTSIVCRACWRKLPRHFTARYRSLRDRARRLTRLSRKRAANGIPDAAVVTAFGILDRQCGRNWDEITACLTRGQAPAGLENFPHDIGMEQ